MAVDTEKEKVNEAKEEASKTPSKRLKKARKKKSAKAGSKLGRRASIPFPTIPFQAALILPEAIQEHAAGQKVRRLTLFEKLGRSPDSSSSRMMITNSNRYGLTRGGYTAEFLELTELGTTATSPEVSETEKLRARFPLSIEGIEPFQYLYERNKGARLPSPEIMRDSLGELSIDEKLLKVCVDTFLENAKFLGLLRTIAGAERLIPIEQVIEERGSGVGTAQKVEAVSPQIKSQAEVTGRRKWEQTCFFIAPIGNEGEEKRKHSDMVLESLITRGLEGEGFEVIRADRIADPGMISSQIIDYLLHSALVIADLSFHNPNVFYELAIRHMVGKPTVHLIRDGDQIPFDVKDFRTIVIDTNDKYDLVAKLDTYRAEIANHVRLAIAGAETGTNPIRAFARNLVVSFD